MIMYEIRMKIKISLNWFTYLQTSLYIVIYSYEFNRLAVAPALVLSIMQLYHCIYIKCLIH
jgi:hypothetical protein